MYLSRGIELKLHLYIKPIQLYWQMWRLLTDPDTHGATMQYQYFYFFCYPDTHVFQQFGCDRHFLFADVQDLLIIDGIGKFICISRFI